MSTVGPDAVAAKVPPAWTGTVEDGQQPYRPMRVGIALALGVVLWLGPYLGVNAVLLPARVAEIAPESKENVVAILATSAMIVATIANILFGALSDLTRSRWGRRTPWIVGGSFASAAMLIVVSSVGSVGLLVLTWCVYQLALNAIVAPLIAVISDRVAPKHRGTISSIYALGYSAGLYGGQIVGAQFLGSINVGFAVLAGVTLLSGPLAAVLMKEGSSLGMPKRSFDKQMLLDNFSFPRRGAHDYYLALFGKFLIVSATFAISGYQLYILTDYIQLSGDATSRYVSLISLMLMGTALVMSALSGPISDKLRRRRLPVVVAAVLVSVGSIVPFFVAEAWTMLAYGLIAGIGMGAFNAVDQALNVEVLPDPNTAAKDLGILNLANTGGQVLGPVLAAVAISVVGYHGIFPTAAALSLVGAVLILFIRSVK